MGRDILNARIPFLHMKSSGDNESSIAHTTVGLTTLGKSKAEQHTLNGPKYDVLDMLDSAGPSTISEIAEECKMGINKAKSIVKSLTMDGYVRKIRSE